MTALPFETTVVLYVAILQPRYVASRQLKDYCITCSDSIKKMLWTKLTMKQYHLQHKRFAVFTIIFVLLGCRVHAVNNTMIDGNMAPQDIQYAAHQSWITNNMAAYSTNNMGHIQSHDYAES